jgi:Icc-related predicted phosphoesterase
MQQIRIAAAGDVHASRATESRLREAFASLDAGVDLVLLAGDLTTHGDPAEAAACAAAASLVSIPVVAVLGNHDLHENRGEEVKAALREGGVVVLDREATVLGLDGVDVGVVGTKGFVGGFAGSSLPDFGEPLLRQAYAETSAEAAAIERGLQEVAGASLRIVLLHYAPIEETLEGEPAGIRTYLGSGRLATPIAEYQPDLVLHGHAHAGSFEGRIGGTPVYNVAVHVTRRDFWIFDLDVTPRQAHVEVES